MLCYVLFMALVYFVKKEYGVAGGIALLSVLLFLVEFLEEYYPGSVWLKRLNASRGPRTDTANMNKHELYESGMQFLIWAVYLFIVLVLLTVPVLSKNHSGYVMGSCIITTILFTGSFIAGAYLMLQGLLTKR